MHACTHTEHTHKAIYAQYFIFVIFFCKTTMFAECFDHISYISNSKYPLQVTTFYTLLRIGNNFGYPDEMPHTYVATVAIQCQEQHYLI